MAPLWLILILSFLEISYIFLNYFHFFIYKHKQQKKKKRETFILSFFKSWIVFNIESL